MKGISEKQEKDYLARQRAFQEKKGLSLFKHIFGMTPEDVQESVRTGRMTSLIGKQNKHRGTLHKHKRKIARASRKANRR